MPTEPHDDSSSQFLRCAWPTEFTKRRKFSRDAENETYLRWLQTDFDDGVEDEDEENLSSEYEDDDFSNESEGEIEGYREKSEYQGPLGRACNNHENETCDRNKNVRLFMKGRMGEEESLPYSDQVEEVARFCEQASLESETKPGQDRTRVALLDDRNIGSSVDAMEGHCRPYLGPLTAQQLRQELSKKRFNVMSNAFEADDIDAERRLIFISDLDPPTIQALTATASRRQAPALKDLFYKHLTGRASIGVNIPSHGYLAFTLDFHIPYCVLKETHDKLKDPRMKSDSEPLRQSWNFPSLSRSINTSTLTSMDRSYSIYEAQVSVVVTGIDHWVWTAYAIVDSVSSRESVDGYDRMNQSPWATLIGRPDPLAVSQTTTTGTIWTPREYFLKVIEMRMLNVLREWRFIVDKVENDVEQSRMNNILPLTSNDPKLRQELRNFSSWNHQMVKLLVQLISALSDTVEAWDEFQRRDIDIFLHDESPSLRPPIVAISKVFAQLKILLLKLERLKKELNDDNPQSVHAHLSLESNEAAIFQQRTARHTQVLAHVVIMFCPLSLAASLFSTQGVLPFVSNLAHFTYVLIILAVLVAAVPLALCNWGAWLHLIDGTVKSSRNASKKPCESSKGNEARERQHGEEQIYNTSTWRALKWSLFPRILSKADPRPCWDLEKGGREPLMGSPIVENVLEGPALPSTSSPEALPDPLASLMGWEGSSKLAKPSTSNAISGSRDASGRRFRLSEMHEDLLHPVRYKAKLKGLQSLVCRESGIAQQSLKTGRGDTKTDHSPAFLLQECQKFLKWILRNVTVLREAGFCSSTATFLRIDPKRTQVAFLESVDLDKIAQLETCIDESKTSLESLRRLDSACKDLLVDHLLSSTPPTAGNIAITSLRLLDLVLVSHVCSHMGDLGCLMSKDIAMGRKFQISSQASKMVDLSVPSDPGTISFSRRTLKCLNGFLCGEQVWVLHGPDINSMDSSELFLSTTPDAFADVWGPMWKITHTGKPLEILRYDLEHGSIVPFSMISGNGRHFVRTELNEELCHWISNSELEKLERALAITSLPQFCRPRLLIGACRHNVIPNTEQCYCNLTDVNNRFVSKGYRRIIGSSPRKWVTESKTVGSTAGGAGLGAPTIQYSHTKKKDGVPVKEAFHKRWKNSTPQLRPWGCLLMRYGLQVSPCTGNSRRVRIVDLIAGDTMKEFMQTNPSYATRPWREAFEELLHTDPARLVTFQADNPIEREDFEEYITSCLDGLIHTGSGSRAHDPFVALWVYNGQPWEIAFPRQYHSWAGFVEDSDSTCSFIVLEKCLVNRLGLKCCHPREDMPQGEIQRRRTSRSAVLETFLTISKRGELPDGLYPELRSDGREHWSVGDLRNRKHCIKLGKQGKLEGRSFISRRIRRNGRNCFKRVLIGEWSSEGTIAAATRVLSAFVTTPETHTEHLCDGSDSEISPLPYFVLEET